MRVVYLAAGAGGMYCGSCLRDHALARALIAQGRDLTLIPLYTPLRTDGRDVSVNRVYYGGLSVALRQHFGYRNEPPRFLRSILDSPALLRAVSRFAVDTDPSLVGELTLSVLRGPDGLLSGELDELIDALREMKPDAVNIPNLMFVGAAGPIKAALGVPIVCTLGGEDLFLDGLEEPYRDEAYRLIRLHSGDIDGFIAVTQYYAGHAADCFDLPDNRTRVVPMGIDATGFEASTNRPNRPFTIGYLARICPEKGLANLAEAVISLLQRGHGCRLLAAGYLAKSDRSYLKTVRETFIAHGLPDSFDYVGEVSREAKSEFLRTIDLLSVPTVYHEAKGLYLLEAMAAGVPAVQPAHGSFPELIKETGGGVLYDPSEPGALPGVIEHLMGDDTLRAELGAAGREAVRTKFTDALMAQRTWSVYEECAARSEQG